MRSLMYKRGVYMAMMMLFLAAQVALGQTREKRDVSNFHELSVSSAFKVDIKVGNTESLEIEVDERYIDDVITEVRGGKLVIRLRDTRGRRRMRESPRAWLTVKSLDAISVSGAVSMRSEDVLKGDNLDIDMSGASVINLAVDVDDLYIEASGACVINMEGRAKEQTLKTSGATVYRAFDLESEIADIRVTGAGSARVSVSDRLDARASGASSIRYKGSPEVNSDSSGASSIKRSN